MCGIAGQFVFHSGRNGLDIAASTTTMVNRLSHRGPDDVGVWQDEVNGVCLAHRRLSILDLSPEGHQPMVSADGRYVMAFNGEVYNHVELRKEIEGGVASEHIQIKPNWRGHSDTEVMLAAISLWGVLEASKRFVGMFAFALWDRAERQLYLVRDRLGEKPLYYGWVGGTLLFGSELKALRAHPAWQGTLDRNALALYLQFNYIPAPLSIYEGVRKLEPGCIAKLGPATDQVEIQHFWSLRESIAAPRFTGTVEAAIEQTEQLLSQSVRQQMIADVPLGAFLSGGIDSSLIVALMQKQSAQPVRTFTIGFHETSYNEADHAAAVARHLGTAHTEFYVTPQDALDVIPLLPTLYDEPFADSSQIPTFLVAKLTKQHVTVSLSGDGGDEFFGGYNRYFWGQNIWNRIKILPLGARRMAAKTLCALPPQAWDRLFVVAGFALPKRLRYLAPGDKVHKLAALLGAKSANEVFLDLISLWKGEDMVLQSKPQLTTATDPSQWPDALNFTEFMMYLDARSYLPDDILVKVDRATMGVSLESRAPFLDHRVVDFAWSLPLDFKIHHGQGKWLLRQILYQHVPRELIDRPKMGFGIPIDRWLRGPLRDWAEALLDESRLRKDGYLNAGPIRQKWAEHLSGRRNWQYHLWGVLMFQAWLEREKEL